MPGNKHDEIKLKVEKAYMAHQLKNKEIAVKFGISENTLKSWIRRYGWSAIRKERKNKGAPQNKKGASFSIGGSISESDQSPR